MDTATIKAPLKLASALIFFSLAGTIFVGLASISQSMSELRQNNEAANKIIAARDASNSVLASELAALRRESDERQAACLAEKAILTETAASEAARRQQIIDNRRSEARLIQVLHKRGRDCLLTRNSDEAASISNGGGYRAVCAHKAGDAHVCEDASVVPWSVSGPFHMAVHRDAPEDQMLYRCVARHHFFSTDPNCEGTQFEGELGYLRATASGSFPRSLRRCNAHGLYYPSLNAKCPIGHEEAFYGYVR